MLKLEMGTPTQRVCEDEILAMRSIGICATRTLVKKKLEKPTNDLLREVRWIAPKVTDEVSKVVWWKGGCVTRGNSVQDQDASGGNLKIWRGVGGPTVKCTVGKEAGRAFSTHKTLTTTPRKAGGRQFSSQIQWVIRL